MWFNCSYCGHMFWIPVEDLHKIINNIAYCSIECACYDGISSITKGFLKK